MSAEDSNEPTITFHVKSSDAKYTLTVPSSMTTSELKEKLATPEYANIPPASLRLIYSGRVLKDADALSSYNIKEGNTMHLVKSAASNQRQNPASSPPASAGTPSSTTSQPPPGVPSNLATGPGNNPLAGLTGARYAGFAQLPGAGMFGPDGGMGPPPSPEDMIQMLSNPQFATMMNEALQNPQVVDMMIQQNPQLRAMGPQARTFLQSEQFRRMMTDPEALRSMANLQRMMGGGLGPGGGGGGEGAFPAPGVTNTTASENQETASDTSNTNRATGTAAPPSTNPAIFGTGGAQTGNPFAALFNTPFNPNAPSTNTDTPREQGQNPSQQNPFSFLLNPDVMGQQAQPNNPSGGSTSPPPNPFLQQNNPPYGNQELLRSLLQAFGGAGAGQNGEGQNPFRDLMGPFMGGSPAPSDNRPPEERYADQLRQLNEMGFVDFDRNVLALQRSGGHVGGAVEWLLSQP